MGLDLNPMIKPAPGNEAEFRKLFNRILNLRDERDMSQELERLSEIGVLPHITAGCPRVGFDEIATQAARDYYASADDPPMSEAEYLEQSHGAWLPDLAPDSDAFPPYTGNALGLADRFSFRGAFLGDEALIAALDGDESYLRLYEPMLADELKQVADDYLALATAYAKPRGLESLLLERDIPEVGDEDDDPRHIVHVLSSFARWAHWWAARGHGMEPDY